MARKSTAKVSSLANMEIEVTAQPGKQTLAMDLMPDIMIYGGAAGCVTGETEYLTPDGWKPIKDYAGEDIYQYNPRIKKLQITSPYFVEYETKDNLYRITNGAGVFQELSMEHRFVFFKKKKSKKLFEIAVGDLIALQQSGHPLRGYIEDPFGKRVPFNIQGKPSTYLKIHEVITTDGKKYCFETPSSYVVFRRGNHVFVTGNSGKSRLLLLKALKFACKDPDFEGVLFRRNTKAHRSAGGLFVEAKKLYASLRPHVREQAMEMDFSAKYGSTGGGTLKFDHLEHESTAETNHQGTQYSFVGFDELTHFTVTQFLYLIGRMRSASEVESFCLCTCNPDADSWVLKWVIPYLDEGGYSREDLCGKMLYFVIENDEPQFAETAQELKDKFPHLCTQENPNTGEIVELEPKTFVYIGGTIFDNPALIKLNPGYLANLKAQTAVKRAQLLDGCWYARAQEDSYFNREWLHKISYADVPNNMKYVRAWDKAASVPSEKYRYPDYTASVKMAKDTDGNIYIFGDYDYDAVDEKSKIIGRFRRLPGDRDRLISTQAHIDGTEVTIVLPRDPSGAGIIEYTESAKKLIMEGFVVKPDPMPSNKAKLQRFMPFSSACQNGFVYIVEDSFPNKETLDHFYRELESFNGERSTATLKDDIPDAAASAFNTLAKEQVFKAVAIPTPVAAMTGYAKHTSGSRASFAQPFGTRRR